MVARTITLVAFMVVWGVATLITAWNDKKVPAELWSIPALGIGAILAAFSTLGERQRQRRQNNDDEQRNADTAATEDEG